MLPPIATDFPAANNISYTNVVTVDLPFDPVIPTTQGFLSAISRANNSTSPITSIPMSNAARTSGVSIGTPGLMIIWLA